MVAAFCAHRTSAWRFREYGTNRNAGMSRTVMSHSSSERENTRNCCALSGPVTTMPHVVRPKMRQFQQSELPKPLSIGTNHKTRRTSQYHRGTEPHRRASQLLLLTVWDNQLQCTGVHGARHEPQRPKLKLLSQFVAKRDANEHASSRLLYYNSINTVWTIIRSTLYYEGDHRDNTPFTPIIVKIVANLQYMTCKTTKSLKRLHREFHTYYK